MNVRADQIDVGDRFVWRGLEVTVVDHKPASADHRPARGVESNGRAGRWLIVELPNGEVTGLHYYADDPVEVA